MHIKLLFTKPQGKVLGAQIVVGAGVDKRIDVLATAIRAGMTVFDLQELELAYAPPYGNAKDPVNMVGYAAGDILEGIVEVSRADELEDGHFLLDVRGPDELFGGTMSGAVSIPLDELRSRLDELPRDRTIHSYCGVGLRSYIACRILSQNGLRAKNLPGGYISYRARKWAELSDADTGQRRREDFYRGADQDS